MRKNRKMLIGTLLVVAAVVLLIAAGFFDGDNVSYRVSVAELSQEGESFTGQRLVTEGNLVGSSVVWNGQDITLTFEVSDLTDPQYRIPVVYNDIKPDNFDEGVQVGLEGTFDGRTFQATKLTTKCPSKYEAAGDNGATETPLGIQEVK